jgi:hypothetical protein
MTYTVRKLDDIAREPWVIAIPGGILGRYKRRSQAITAARLLAGWRGNVVAEGRGK